MTGSRQLYFASQPPTSLRLRSEDDRRGLRVSRKRSALRTQRMLMASGIARAPNKNCGQAAPVTEATPTIAPIARWLSRIAEATMTTQGPGEAPTGASGEPPNVLRKWLNGVQARKEEALAFARSAVEAATSVVSDLASADGTSASPLPFALISPAQKKKLLDRLAVAKQRFRDTDPHDIATIVTRPDLFATAKRRTQQETADTTDRLHRQAILSRASEQSRLEDFYASMLPTSRQQASDDGGDEASRRGAVEDQIRRLYEVPLQNILQRERDRVARRVAHERRKAATPLPAELKQRLFDEPLKKKVQVRETLQRKYLTPL